MTNEILEEIHRVREQHARECGCDIHKVFEQIRQGTERLKAEGWPVAPPVVREGGETLALREQPPQP